jgi:3-dehydroquinate synthase
LSQDVSLTLQYRHRVWFTRDAFAPENPALSQAFEEPGGEPAGSEPARRGQALVVLDSNVATAWPDLTDRLWHYWQQHDPDLPALTGIHTLPGGEAAKNDQTVLQSLLKAVADAGLCRHSYVLAIGGGAVLDAAGFAAGIAHRGIRLVRMPTTTLSQDDAGVGVKNGVNAFGKKNFLGTFAVPSAVVNDLRLLETLSDREWRCGLSEAIKVALIKEPSLFEKIEANAQRLAHRDATIADEVWEASARLHVDHIASGGDPFEETTARPLDFGHWSAHRLESLSDYELRHGEAVAIGLALDVTASELTGLLNADTARRIRQCLLKLGFKLYHPALAEIDSLMQGLDEFREHLGGELTLTMLEGVGRPVDVHELDRATVEAAISRLAETSTDPAAV